MEWVFLIVWVAFWLWVIWPDKPKNGSGTRDWL
jgi:hypothetical protein